MITQYDRIEGVPKDHYYLQETMVFGDFGVTEQTKIICTSANPMELLANCVACKHSCYQAGNDESGWYTHYIFCRDGKLWKPT